MEVPPWPNRSASDAKRHSRNASYQRSLPRRSTKGPLDEPDDPLTSSHQTDAPPPSTIPLPTSPPKPPPRPLTIHPPPPPPQPERDSLPPEKDLTFLLHPSNFTTTLPPPLYPPPPSPSPSSPSTTTDHPHHLATAALTKLTSPHPPTTPQIFSLYHQRLTSLLQLSHRAIAAVEASVFEDVMAPFWHHPPSSSEHGTNIIPWDLRVLITRLSDGGRVVGGLYALAREARAAIKLARRRRDNAQKEEVELWKQRLRGLGIATAEALIEDGDIAGAVGVLRGLMAPGQEGREEVARMLVLAYIRVGDVGAAKRVCKEMGGADEGKGVESVVSLCEGEFEGAAAQILRGGSGGAGMRNNLAVTRFYSGDIGEAVRLLEELVDGEGDPTREIIFNLATCYELTGENGVRERKEQLVRRVGERGGGALAGLGRADFKL